MSVSIKQLHSLNAHQWQALLLKHAPLAICALATIGMAWQASQLTWLFAGKSAALGSAPVGPVAAPTPVNARSSVDVQSIADAHLFGLPAVESNVDTSNLPQSQIGLILAGTMALDDPTAGFAIIGENPANARFYRVGQMIGGARLHSVYADRAILDRGGRLEALVLPRGAPSMGGVPARMPPPPNNGVGDNLRRLAQTNPNAIGEMLRAQPVFAGGAQKGYRVYPGRDRQQFTRLGLQPGDLITSVNGTPLDDPSRSNEILNTMNSSSSVTVTVERNGATQQLTLDVAQLSLPEASSAAPGAADTSAAGGSSSAESVNSGATFGPGGLGPNGTRSPPNRGGTPPANPAPGPSAQ